MLLWDSLLKLEPFASENFASTHIVIVVVAVIEADDVVGNEVEEKELELLAWFAV